MNKTILIIGIIFLLAGISINSSVAIFDFNDDTTPPVTTHSLDPPEPDGDNGWYVSDVNVTLTANDDMSGVNMTYYRVNDGEWEIYNSTFVISEDGNDILIEYYSVDNVGNIEQIKLFFLDIDQTVPIVDYYYDWESFDEENDTYLFEFNATATDITSKMNRVEFIVDNEVYETVYGPGPVYSMQILVDFDLSIKGFICKRNITDDYVKFYAIVVNELSICNSFYGIPYMIAYDNAGNDNFDLIPDPPPYPEKKFFKWYKFPNDYEGEIGSYYIDAIFEKSPIAVSMVPNVLNLEPNNLFLRFLDHFPLLHRLLDILRWN